MSHYRDPPLLIYALPENLARRLSCVVLKYHISQNAATAEATYLAKKGADKQQSARVLCLIIA